jgi:hypothetical protein
MDILTVTFDGRFYQVTLDAWGMPIEIKREGVSKHRIGKWIRIWHRRQRSPGNSVVVAGILRFIEADHKQATDQPMRLGPLQVDGQPSAVDCLSTAPPPSAARG